LCIPFRDVFPSPNPPSLRTPVTFGDCIWSGSPSTSPHPQQPGLHKYDNVTYKRFSKTSPIITPIAHLVPIFLKFIFQLLRPLFWCLTSLFLCFPPTMFYDTPDWLLIWNCFRGLLNSLLHFFFCILGLSPFLYRAFGPSS